MVVLFINLILFFIFVIFLTSGDLFLFIIISCLTGFFLGADLVLLPSIQADLTDIHKLKYKEEVSGTLFSLITLITKLSFALGSLFVFGILGILNFEANSIVSKETSNFIILSYSILPVILKVAAFIILNNFKSSEDELINFCRKHLAAYKCPRKVIFVDDVPKTSSGKIMRRELNKLDNTTIKKN